MTIEPKIPGAIIPRRVFTQPGSDSAAPRAESKAEIDRLQTSLTRKERELQERERNVDAAVQECRRFSPTRKSHRRDRTAFLG